MPARTQQPTTVTITPDSDAWRYTCPEGHTTWSRCNNHWWCQSCAQAAQQGADIDPEFQRLRDQKSGRELSRDEVEYDGIPL